jgi:hypothetical protein
MKETQDPTSPEALAAQAQAERTKRVHAVGWTAGMSAFFLAGGLTASTTWPMAIGVVAISAMVAVACYFMLRQP